MRLPVFRSTATDFVPFDLGGGEELAAAVVELVVQRTWPFTSDRTRFEVLVRTSEGAEEEMAGASRFATDTTVS
jgi:hypothetical protein